MGAPGAVSALAHHDIFAALASIGIAGYYLSHSARFALPMPTAITAAVVAAIIAGVSGIVRAAFEFAVFFGRTRIPFAMGIVSALGGLRAARIAVGDSRAGRCANHAANNAAVTAMAAAGDLAAQDSAEQATEDRPGGGVAVARALALLLVGHVVVVVVAVLLLRRRRLGEGDKGRRGNDECLTSHDLLLSVCADINRSNLNAT